MAAILIVDDDARTRGVVQCTLETAHHTVRQARNGVEALQLLAASPVDLVITYILMPEKDGYEIIGELRRSNPHIKVVAYSGGYSKLNFDVLMAAKALGAHATLPKPFSMSELLSVVHQVLALKPS